METNLLDRMLNTYLNEQTTVTVTLQNRSRVSGRIKAFDGYVIYLEGQRREILYRHAVSSLSPVQPEAQKRIPPQQTKPQVKTPPKPTNQKPKAVPAQTVHAASFGESINNGMKEGLIKWMQEQKAAK